MTEVIRIPKSGDVIGGQFQLKEEIGRGGFGVVFRARQLGVERNVAVKMLLPHAMTHEGVIERFKREARLASSLTHRNSVTIYAYGIHQEGEGVQGLPYLAMEYLEGETLQGYLVRHRRLTYKDALDILKQALGSLAEAHKKGIVHRDLKPENIFICNRNREDRIVKVLDFGIAKTVAGEWDAETKERLTRTGLVAGTAEYMAPEQASGQKDITPAVDVYAMGCIAFQMVTGNIPYDGNSPMDVAIKHISEPIPPLPSIYQDHFIGRVIRCAMAKDAKQRFRDAMHYLEVLESGYMPDDGQGYNLTQDTSDLSLRSGEFESGSTIVDESLTQGDDLGTANTAFINAFDEDEASTIPSEDGGKKRNTGALLIAVALLFIILGAVIAAVVGLGALKDPPTPAVAVQPARANPPKKVEAPPKKVEAPPKVVETPPKKVEAAPQMAVVIYSDTPGAMVYRNGEKLGPAPFTFRREGEGLEPIQLELRLEGYKTTPLTVDWKNLKNGDVVQNKLVPHKKARPSKRANKRPVKTKSTPAPVKTTKPPVKTVQSPQSTDVKKQPSEKPKKHTPKILTNDKKNGGKTAPAVFAP